MNKKKISKMYIICCDFTPFNNEKYKKNKYNFIRVEYNNRYALPMEESTFFIPENYNKVKMMAYAESQLDELKQEIKYLNEFYSDSKDGKYHFYIRKLNIGSNTFKLKEKCAISNFHSTLKNKKLDAHYFKIVPIKKMV